MTAEGYILELRRRGLKRNNPEGNFLLDVAEHMAEQFREISQLKDRLYIAAQAAPTKEPLTDDEIQAVYLRTYNEGFPGRNLEAAFARAIEAAHGIGGKV